jgi:hypothetical protein
MSNASSSTESKIPRLATASSGQGGLPHSVWRPQMQTFLMRQGIEERDYSEPFPHWKEVVAAIDADEKAEEQAAIAEMLGKNSAAAAGSTTTAAASSTKTAEQIKRKQRVIDAVARVRKAYAFLYAALPADLRSLVADQPQGYAYGVWNFLEKKFRNTEQDSVMALWEQLTSLRQDTNSDENFAEYKARVDSVRELLENAKQQIGSGLYASLLLWRLRPAYQTAVLTLKTGDKLLDTDKIDWQYIAEWMSQFERSQQGLNDTAAGAAGGEGDRAYAAKQQQKSWSNVAGQQKKQPADLSHIKCYNCNVMGHYASDCKQPRRQQAKGSQERRGNDAKGVRFKKESRSHSGSSSDSDDEAREGKHRSRSERANAARVVSSNRYDMFRNSDADDEDEQPAEKPAREVEARSYLARALAGLQGGQEQASADKREQPREFKRLRRNADASPAPAVRDNRQAKPVSPPPAAAPVPAVAARDRIAAAQQPEVPAPRRKPQAKGLDAELRTSAKAVDSAASVAMTPNKDTLLNVRRCAPMPIKVADGTVVTAVYKGDMPLRLNVENSERPVRVIIRDVYWHERFDANLLSWGLMRKDGWKLNSSKDGTFLTTPGGKTVRASTRGNLTILDDADPERVYSAAMGKIVCTSVDDVVSLHQRLGHVSWSRMKKMSRAGLTTGIGDIDAMPAAEKQQAEKAVKECTACAQGKQRRNTIGRSGLDKGSEAGEVIHMDTMYVVTRNQHTKAKQTSYALLATDGHSEWRWSACTDNMVDLQQECIDIVQHSHTMTGRYPRLIVTDLGGEFDNGRLLAFCKRNGIHHQPSPARAKQLNGVSEKSVDTVKNHTRTMLLASGVPEHIGKKLAIHHHTYVWNRTHVGRRSGTTPYQAMMKRKPSILNLGVFGCDAFVHQDKSQRDTTFSAKAEPAIYLGHDPRQNAPRVRMLHTGKVVVAKDVMFRENSFTHVAALREGRAADIQPLSDDDAGEDATAVANAPDPPQTADAESSNDDSEHSDDDASDDDSSNNVKQFKVSSIRNERTVDGKKEYEVKWVGYPAATWEPADIIKADAPAIVQKYEQFVQRRSEARVTRSRAPPPPPAVDSDSDEEEEKNQSEHQQAMAARTVAASRL